MDEGWVRAAGAGLRISANNGTALPLSYTRKLVLAVGFELTRDYSDRLQGDCRRPLGYTSFCISAQVSWDFDSTMT